MAFLFPGQGSQYVGMAKDLFEEFSSVSEIFTGASEILKYDLAEVCFTGPEEKLKQTAYTQPAIFVHSFVLDMILKENFIKPSCAAGHSLGEYTALTSSGALSFDQALKAIAKRSAVMQEDCDRQPGAMAAILGLKYDEVVEALGSAEGISVPANYNSPDQIVISGEKNAVDTACAKLKEAGAKRALPLQVAGAYHSPLMTRSAETMRQYISQMQFGDFGYPVYSNVGAEPVLDGEAFKELLASQILNPVMWYPILQNMYRDGVRLFVEIGPGKALQGMVKRSFNDPEIEIFGIDTLDDLDQFMNQYAETDDK
ncbi:MAG TPA: [acyl-carrier-protein] S-malonyltransferase [candidate division Zixibacteria bacterium]|nr:[acyl-carrier-protein] S-malonyltransferase [candidate division Zixibacteria bacterium]HBZ01855.1 [acyl-carrier-protein] S-malonyltransferase [candidate division Zixibacteria bacterium]